MLRRYDIPKGQIDACPHRRLRLRHAMNPMMLARAAHDEQAAVREVERPPLFGRDMLQNELPCCAEGQGCNHRIDAEFRLGIRVKADGVLTIAIEIEQ